MTYVHQFVSAKGGQGTSTVAGMVAVLNAEAGNKTLLVSDVGRSVVGVDVENLTIGTPRNFESDTQVFDVVIVDGRQGQPDRISLVTTPCYLALRAAIQMDEDDVDDIVFMNQADRALQSRDVEATLGKRIAAIVTWSPVVARCVDAGLVGMRLPAHIRRELRPFVINNEEND